MNTATKVIVTVTIGLVLSATAVGVGAATSSTRTVTKVVNHTVVRTVIHTVTKPVVHTVTKVVTGPTVTKTVTLPGATVTPVSCLVALPEADNIGALLLRMVHDAENGQSAQLSQDNAQYNVNVPSFNTNEALCEAGR